MTRFWAVLPVVLLVLLAGLSVIRLGQDKGERSDLFQGRERPAPELKLDTLEGGTFALEDLKGEPVYINVWATWCLPCKAEHPRLMQLAEQGVKIIGVAYKDDSEKVRRELEATGNPFSFVLLDPEGLAGLDLGVTGVPETFLVDSEGMITSEWRRAINEDDMSELMKAWDVANTPSSNS